MFKKIYIFVMMVIILAIVALPAAASDNAGVNLPGWVAWILIIIALALPLVIFANMGRRS